MFPGERKKYTQIDSPLRYAETIGVSQPMWTTQRFNRGVDGRRLAFFGAALRHFSAQCKPGVTDALLSAIYHRGVWKGTNASQPKIRFFFAWEIRCVAWEHVRTCKSVCHTAKPWELAALVQLSSVDNNYASLNICHILRCSDWL